MLHFTSFAIFSNSIKPVHKPKSSDTGHYFISSHLHCSRSTVLPLFEKIANVTFTQDAYCLTSHCDTIIELLCHESNSDC